MSDTYTYFFTDIEADGPIPGPYSMISVASVACSDTGQVRGEYEANLQPLPDAGQHPDTMAWWKTEPDAWAYSTKNPRPPAEVMSEYAAWISSQPGTPVFVAHPVHFDHMWVNWYLVTFTGARAFNGPSVDIESYTMATFGCSILECNRRSWPAAWLDGYQHTHKAIDDARGYAQAFFSIQEYNKSLSRDQLPDTPGQIETEKLKAPGTH